MSAKILH